MKIFYDHLLRFFPDKPSIMDVSEKLFQLGHEHEVNDDCFELEFTPNRGDCLSLLGLSRDLSVFYETNTSLEIYNDHIPALNLNFKNEAADLCPQIKFLKIKIDAVNSNYADYINDYFQKVGSSKVNFFTDISNYLSYEMGQPTHCYDFKDIGSSITLKKNEKKINFKTLLNDEIKINESDLVFESNNELINLAGVMGGIKTACKGKTLEVLIECAHFKPSSIIGKSTKYNLNSDASYKFERGTDPLILEKTLRRFLKIVKDHAKVLSCSLYSYSSEEINPKELDFDPKQINKILGTNIENKNLKEMLNKLGFLVENKICVPSYRNDILHQNDIAEEVARVIGYDNLPRKEIELKPKNNSQTSKTEKIKTYLVKNGFSEVINFPFSNSNEDNCIEILNPLDSNKKFMRTNLIDSLKENLIYNEKRQKDSIKLFEISDIYSEVGNIRSEKRLALIISGRQGLNYEEFSKKLNDKYLEDLFASIGINIKDKVFTIERKDLDSKSKAKVFGLELVINDLNIENLDIDSKSPAFENSVKYKVISDMPSSSRDFSFSITEKGKVAEVINTLNNIDYEIIKDSFMFDFFDSKKTGEIKVGYRFIFQSAHKTLKDIEIDEYAKKIIDKITSIKSVYLPGIDNNNAK
tara:strand:- start:1185 stop:3101 length:1917 start_codon:yes stop_codon:yes gene_type:complete